MKHVQLFEDFVNEAINLKKPTKQFELEAGIKNALNYVLKKHKVNVDVRPKDGYIYIADDFSSKSKNLNKAIKELKKLVSSKLKSSITLEPVDGGYEIKYPIYKK